MRVFSQTSTKKWLCWVKGSPTLYRGGQGKLGLEREMVYSGSHRKPTVELDLGSCSHVFATKGRVLSLPLWPPVDAHLCLKGDRNRGLSSKSSELGQ